MNRETRRTLPTGEPRGLDEPVFRDLLRRALLTYVATMRSTGAGSLRREIVHFPIESGTLPREVALPDYSKWDRTQARSTIARSEFSALLDYLWDQGEVRLTLTGPDPQRANWEIAVLHQLIHEPLAKLLHERILRHTVANETVDPWALGHPDLAALLDLLCGCFCHGRFQYLAQCPLGWVDSDVGLACELSTEVRLRMYTPAERALYLTRHERKLEPYDGQSRLVPEDVAVLEIADSVEEQMLVGRDGPRGGIQILEEAIADALDVAKWALFVALGYTGPLVEGTIVYEGVLGGNVLERHALKAFRRQHRNYGAQISLDEGARGRARVLFQGASALRNRWPDLRQAFWYWGRSAVAALERDMLLDAVVGLESLLVSTPGESMYRFRLHGTALLAESEAQAEECSKALRSIYNKRSAAAHGSRDERVAEAHVALKYLAQAISAVLRLTDAGVMQASGRVAQQIEHLVLNRAPLAEKRK